MTTTARSARVAGSILAWAIGVIGVSTISLTLFGVLGGYGLVLFKTGSMAPTIPAGGVALTHKIPAAQIRTGDVITVHRPGHEPVTHRVVHIDPAAGHTMDWREVTLKGDANQAADPSPYVIDTAPRVIASVPFGAQAIAAFDRPAVRVTGLLLAAAIIVWMLWPGPARTAVVQRQDSDDDADTIDFDEARDARDRADANLAQAAPNPAPAYSAMLTTRNRGAS